MNIREMLYKTEEETLSKYAMLCRNTRGRETAIKESDIRTEFMRDRDRITHSKSFRRLKDKTQVFINPEGSHYRTRLTHTLEVSQIARTIARALRLNQDLTEAIALGHDLGHTPFGHEGERAIAKCLLPFGRTFSHNVQSLRIVEKLENGRGLNLTFEVRDGILNHRKGMQPATMEGLAVNYADRIAYLNHDIDDALRARIITIGDLPEMCIRVLGDTYSRRLDTMVTDIVTHSSASRELGFSERTGEAVDLLRSFMFEKVYKESEAKLEEKKVQNIVDLFFEYYEKHPNELPEADEARIEEDGLEICIADYVSGMTDKYAVTKFQELFIPKSWMML